MPLITPKTDWIAGDSVGFSDMNRIEGNVLYLQNENKTINGTNTFTGASTFSSTLGVTGLTSLSTLNTTGLATLNSASVTTTLGVTGLITVGATGITGATNDLILNTNTGNTVNIQVNSVDVATFSGTQIDFLQPTVITETGSFPLTLYRTVASAGTGCALNWDMNNAVSDQTTYGRITTTIDATAAGAEGGTIKIIPILNGSLASVAEFSGSQIDFKQKVTLENESTFSVDFSGTREILQIRARDVLANGAGINLYGSADSVNPDKIILYADSGVRLQSSDGTSFEYKKIDIGTWNMDGTTNITVAHGLTYDDILSVYVTIIADTGSLSYDLNYIGDGSHYTTATDIFMERVGGGTFDNATFDGVQNRGYIFIKYKV